MQQSVICVTIQTSYNSPLFMQQSVIRGAIYSSSNTPLPCYSPASEHQFGLRQSVFIFRFKKVEEEYLLRHDKIITEANIVDVDQLRLLMFLEITKRTKGKDKA